MVDTTKAICNVCKKDAFFNSLGKWWCGALAEEGQYNLKGVCRNDLSRNSK
jgi:hypothetical protein|tara:strand:+ start:1465 stop:1617 length:153 start_codon:yes stop_codon:yes gene_type:complete